MTVVYGDLHLNIADDSINPAEQISNFINTYGNGRTIIMPLNKTYVLEKQIVIDGVTNSIVDFNGCTLKLPDSCAWTPEWEKYALAYKNCSNCTINSLIIDGNQANQSGADSYGFVTKDSINITINNLISHDVVHHCVWVQSGSKHVVFNNPTLYNAFVYASAAEVYIETGEADSVEFYNTTVYRTERLGNQAFYVHGNNTLIDGVIATGIPGYVLDYRTGIGHVANNINTEDCGGILIMQPSGAGTAPTLTASNLTGVNMIPRAGVDQAVYIKYCAGLTLTGVEITSNAVIERQSYGIRIYPTNLGDVKNVVIDNFKASEYWNAGICLYGTTLDESCHLSNVTLQPGASSSPGYTVWCEFVLVDQYIDGLTEIPAPNRRDPDNHLIIT